MTRIYVKYLKVVRLMMFDARVEEVEVGAVAKDSLSSP